MAPPSLVTPSRNPFDAQWAPISATSTPTSSFSSKPGPHIPLLPPSTHLITSLTSPHRVHTTDSLSSAFRLTTPMNTESRFGAQGERSEVEGVSDSFRHTDTNGSTASSSPVSGRPPSIFAHKQSSSSNSHLVLDTEGPGGPQSVLRGAGTARGGRINGLESVSRSSDPRGEFSQSLRSSSSGVCERLKDVGGERQGGRGESSVQVGVSDVRGRDSRGVREKREVGDVRDMRERSLPSQLASLRESARRRGDESDRRAAGGRIRPHPPLKQMHASPGLPAPASNTSTPYSRAEREEGAERSDRGERGERSERGERGERNERGERSGRSERGERGEKSERNERGEGGERVERGGERGKLSGGNAHEGKGTRSWSNHKGGGSTRDSNPVAVPEGRSCESDERFKEWWGSGKDRGEYLGESVDERNERGDGELSDVMGVGYGGGGESLVDSLVRNDESLVSSLKLSNVGDSFTSPLMSQKPYHSHQDEPHSRRERESVCPRITPLLEADGGSRHAHRVAQQSPSHAPLPQLGNPPSLGGGAPHVAHLNVTHLTHLTRQSNSHNSHNLPSGTPMRHSASPNESSYLSHRDVCINHITNTETLDDLIVNQGSPSSIEVTPSHQSPATGGERDSTPFTHLHTQLKFEVDATLGASLPSSVSPTEAIGGYLGPTDPTPTNQSSSDDPIRTEPRVHIPPLPLQGNRGGKGRHETTRVETAGGSKGEDGRGRACDVSGVRSTKRAIVSTGTSLGFDARHMRNILSKAKETAKRTETPTHTPHSPEGDPFEHFYGDQITSDSDSSDEEFIRMHMSRQPQQSDTHKISHFIRLDSAGDDDIETVRQTNKVRGKAREVDTLNAQALKTGEIGLVNQGEAVRQIASVTKPSPTDRCSVDISITESNMMRGKIKGKAKGKGRDITKSDGNMALAALLAAQTDACWSSLPAEESTPPLADESIPVLSPFRRKKMTHLPLEEYTPSKRIAPPDLNLEDEVIE
eukprot:GHVN01015339.1.p1 GENE.GHVN01015339.1~~GHVN01015339.1.p1  ORF type:complete len:1114 (+),score=366.85 GHVN01015339.1:386-3343(+)